MKVEINLYCVIKWVFLMIVWTVLDCCQNSPLLSSIIVNCFLKIFMFVLWGSVSWPVGNFVFLHCLLFMVTLLRAIISVAFQFLMAASFNILFS